MNAPAPILATLPAQIAAAHEAAQTAHKSAVAHAVRAGELLLSAKANVPHGEWLAWIDANCKFTARTATGYMRIALLPRPKQQRVADLSLRQALDVLAEPRKKSLAAPKPEAPVEQVDHGGEHGAVEHDVPEPEAPKTDYQERRQRTQREVLIAVISQSHGHARGLEDFNLSLATAGCNSDELRAFAHKARVVVRAFRLLAEKLERAA
jgi:hypothetical protein